jgi:hypothetical protein
MTERPSYIVAGLIANRRELVGIIAELERQLEQHRRPDAYRWRATGSHE